MKGSTGPEDTTSPADDTGVCGGWEGRDPGMGTSASVSIWSWSRAADGTPKGKAGYNPSPPSLGSSGGHKFMPRYLGPAVGLVGLPMIRSNEVLNGLSWGV